jgi:cell division transport system permease protein
LIGMMGIWLLPSADAAGGFLTGLGFQGAGWIWPLLLPLLAGIIAFIATRTAAFRKLRDLT